MTLEEAITIIGESAGGITTHNQAFRTACQLACTTMNAALRNQEEQDQS